MQNNKPKYTDPKEFSIIRDIYFEKDNLNKEEIDPIEKLERMESKHRNLNNNSR
jgi:hypothetical protein